MNEIVHTQVWPVYAGCSDNTNKKKNFKTRDDDFELRKKRLAIQIYGALLDFHEKTHR